MAANHEREELPLPVLHAADHQVAGHRFEEGQIGSSVDDSGRFYKPLPADERGDREIDFYNHLQADEHVPPHVHAFFPKYFGTISIEAPNSGGSVRHLVMDDLAHGYRHPSIIDLKVGARTWYPEAGEHKIKKYKLKDKMTTSGTLGFRVSGMQVYDSFKGTTFKADRDWARNLAVDEVPVVLKRYVSTDPWNATDPDAAFVASVYGGPTGIIAQLKLLEDWFSRQTYYHFASSSLLFLYEGDLSSSVSCGDGMPCNLKAPSGIMVKMVDFAHTICGKCSLDENFLGGLQSLISILSSIVQSHSQL